MNTLEKNISLSGVFYVNQATSGFGREKKIFQFQLSFLAKRLTGQTSLRNLKQETMNNKKLGTRKRMNNEYTEHQISTRFLRIRIHI